jgi:thiamine biosynthesis lipoprotein
MSRPAEKARVVCRIACILALAGCQKAPLAADTPPLTSAPVQMVATASAAVMPRFEAVRVTDDSQHAMGTHLTFAAYTTELVNEAAARAAFVAAGDEIRRIETLMTTWRPDSERWTCASRGQPGDVRGRCGGDSHE